MSKSIRLLIAACVLLCGCAATPRNPPPPGRLIDVGGWRLHVNCTGEHWAGRPTVLLEAGSGDFSFDWSLVQSSVEDFTRVCSYDRAGSAWSELGPRPRTIGQIVYELHTALGNGGIEPPYVMVGHSAGGLIVRRFSEVYSKDVFGVVLVDGTHEDVRLSIAGKLQRVRETSTGKAIPGVRARLPREQRTLTDDEARNAAMMIEFAGAPAIVPPFDRLPAIAQRWRVWAQARPEHFIADDDPYWPEELQAMYEARLAAPAPLGGRPLIVISRDLKEPADGDADRNLLSERRLWQEDLARLSAGGRLFVAEGSGHHVQIERPDVVIDAIRSIVADTTANPDTPD